MSSAKYSHVDQRGQAKAKRLKFTKINPNEVKFSDLRNNGEAFRQKFISKTKKTLLAEKFYATGHMDGDMPRAMYSKKKVAGKKEPVEYIPYFNDLCSQISGYLLKVHFEGEQAFVDYKAKINPNAHLRGETPLLDFRKLTLLLDVPDAETKYDILMELHKRTEPLPKEEVITEIQKQKEKNKARVRSLLIPAAIEFHVPRYVEPFVDTLSAKDHLLFLKDSIAAQGLTPKLRKHFPVIKEKTERVRQRGTKSRIYAGLSILEDNPDEKVMLFHYAIGEATLIHTREARNSCLHTLYNLAQAHARKPIYAELAQDEAFYALPDQKQEKEEDILATPLPVIHTSTSKKELLEKAERSISNANKSVIYESLSLMSETQEDKEQFFQMAMDCANAMLSPKSKAARAVSLRSSAPTEEMQLSAHQIVLKHGSYRQLLQDMATINSRKSAISKIGLDLTVKKELALSIDRGDRAQNVNNQKNFARESRKFDHLTFWDYI